ncbi:MAG: hypothetical protein HQM10_16085 [Candidatus Riflebacteria bacterium]|nr:hypothetical protein [Candidatus Riflebacteria bacterium]
MASTKKKKSGCTGSILRILFYILIAAIIFSGIIYWKKDSARNLMRRCLVVKPSKVNLNLAALIGTNQMKGTVTLGVFSYFPFGINLTNLNYSMFLNEVPIAKGIRTASASYIAPLATTSLELTFTFDRINTTKALAKTAPEKVLKTAESVLDQLRGKKTKRDSLGDIVRIEGKADFRLLFGAFEIPLDGSVNFKR